MTRISRRDILKIGAAGISAGVLSHSIPAFAQQGAEDRLDLWREQYAPGKSLGRVLARLNLRVRPDAESASAGFKFKDDIVEILREVVGRGPITDPHNHRWFETPEGYLWAPHVFPLSFQINEPLQSIPGGKVWAEVTVPWVAGRIKPAFSSPLRELPSGPAYLYYASVYPVIDSVTDGDGRQWYLLDELAAPMYALAEGLRVITAEEIAPLSPDVENKLVHIDLNRQTLSAFENGVEVFFAVIASGPYLADTERWSTPPGEHPIWRKRIGMRMSAGDLSSGYDVPGVGWTTLFVGDGVAIHSTYWHNDYGIPKSHGCVNTRPDDAKWIFRWTLPVVPYPAGDIQVQMPGGTRVRVVV